MSDPMSDNPSNPFNSNEQSQKRIEKDLNRRIQNLSKEVTRKSSQLEKVKSDLGKTESKFEKYKLEIERKEEEDSKSNTVQANVEKILNEVHKDGNNKIISKAISTILDKYFSREWLFPVFGILLVIAQILLFCNQNQLLDIQNTKVQQQNLLMEAQRRSSYVFMMGNLIESANNELADPKNASRHLSKQLIGQIIALSNSLSPYRFMIGDTLTTNLLSPERGMLLIFLLESGINSIDLNKIFEYGVFQNSYAQDLNIVNDTIQHLDLRNSKFEYVNMEYSEVNHIVCMDCAMNYLSISDGNYAELTFERLDSLKRLIIYNAHIISSRFSPKHIFNVELYDSQVFELEIKTDHINFIEFDNCRVEDSNIEVYRILDLHFHHALLTGSNTFNSNKIVKSPVSLIEGRKETDSYYATTIIEY